MVSCWGGGGSESTTIRARACTTQPRSEAAKITESQVRMIPPCGQPTSSVAACHARAEVGELLDPVGWAGVVRAQAGGGRREAVGQGDGELLERLHLAIEPGLGARTQAVRPA